MNVLERRSASSLGTAAGSSVDACPAQVWKPHAAWWLSSSKGLRCGQAEVRRLCTTDTPAASCHGKESGSLQAGASGVLLRQNKNSTHKVQTQATD